MELQRDHADLGGELDDLVVDVLICAGMSHDFCGVILPDRICKMKSAVFRRSSRIFRKCARQHCRGVGDEDRLLRKEILHRSVYADFCFRILSHGLDHDISVLAGLCHIELNMKLLRKILCAGCSQSIDFFCRNGLPVRDESLRIEKSAERISDQCFGSFEVSEDSF